MRRKNLLFGTTVCLVIFAVIVWLFSQINARIRRDAILEQVDPQQPMVALTFDDGPNVRYTPQILDILYETQTPATFFLIGEKLAGQELLVKEIASSGHEIGNHTYSHQNLAKLDCLEIRQEIQKMQETLRNILPDYTIRYLRPPYGSYTQEVEQTADIPLVLWTVDSGDWEEKGDAQPIIQTVPEQIQNGGIVVFHDDNPYTVEALQVIIPALKEKGFQFVTISQLYACQKKG